MSEKDQAAELLIDAQLVVDFASRAGLLEQPNDPLIEEIHNVKKQIGIAGDQKDNNIHLGKLYVALSKSVKTIGPYITLRELRDGYSPFDKTSLIQRISVLTLLILFSFSLVFTITLIQRLQNNLTQLNEIDAINKTDNDKQVKIVVRRILDGSQKKPASEGFSSYLEALENAKKTTAQINEIISYAAMQDKGPLYDTIKLFFPFVVMGSDPPQGSVSGSYTPSETSNQIYTSQKNPYGDSNKYTFAGTTPSTSLSCKDIERDLAKLDGIEAAEKTEAFTKCVITSLGFLNEIGQQRLVLIVRERTMEVYVLAAWLLPLCAGMLGASVYLIYNYYFDKLRPLGSPILVVIRYILGGIAGLIIGWFYAPARYPENGVDLIDSIRQFPFMFAFLAGFSSEYAFSLMTKVISTSSNQLGTKLVSGYAVSANASHHVTEKSGKDGEKSGDIDDR